MRTVLQIVLCRKLAGCASWYNLCNRVWACTFTATQLYCMLLQLEPSMLAEVSQHFLIASQIVPFVLQVDPEEFKEMQSQLKGTTSSSGPSAGNALPASRGGR